MSSPLIPAGWRTLGVNRWRIGPYTSFGKGITLDQDGNTYRHLLEVDSIDHNPTYGDVDVFTEEEKNFELLYKDEQNDPDYVNNHDKLGDMKDVVYDEPVYVCADAGSAPASLTFETEFGPLILDDASVYPFDWPVLVVRGKDGVNKAFVTDISLIDYDSTGAKDRLSAYPANILKTNSITINSFPAFSWVDGDTIYISYIYFHHSDMLRDGASYSVWSTAKGRASSYITIDVSPAGNAKLLQDVNNIELVAPEMNFPVGASEYIIQAGIPDALGNINYKVLTSGNFILAKAGESTVVKFDKINLRYLRAILIGSAVGAYVTVDINSSDPALAAVLTAEDLYNVTAIPYYVDSNVADVQGTIYQGAAIPVADVIHNNIGRLYIPQYNVYDVGERKHYTLSHIDLRIGTSFVYRGLPSTFLGAGIYTEGIINIGTVGVADVYPVTPIIADTYLPIKYDLISRNSNVGDQYFSTLFKNIVDFQLTLIDANGIETVLEDSDVTPPGDYTINKTDGRINYPAGLGLNGKLRAVYNFNVIKTSEVDTPEKYLRFLRAKSNLESIVYADIKVFVSRYFLDYVPNDIGSVYEFEINPANQSDTAGAEAQLVKLLDGSYVKQIFGTSRTKWSISGEKISDDMYQKFKELEAYKVPLGIVTDTLEFKKVIIVPNSLKGNRRKTTAIEYDEVTTTWSYSMDIQEV